MACIYDYRMDYNKTISKQNKKQDVINIIAVDPELVLYKWIFKWDRLNFWEYAEYASCVTGIFVLCFYISLFTIIWTRALGNFFFHRYETDLKLTI